MSEATASSMVPHRGHILVVDDDMHVQAALSRLLSSVGWNPSSAWHGQQALHLLRDGYRPSAMLVDRDMPVMSGPDLLASLRAVPELAAIPVVCMSGREWPEAGELFLEKPFRAEALFAALAAVVR